MAKRSTAKTTATPEKIANVTVAVARPDTIEKYLGLVNIKVAPSMTLAKMIEALAAYVETSVPKTRIADCDVCGGSSDADWPECPFCGEGGVNLDATETKPAEAAKPVDEPKPEPVVEELAGGIVEPEQGNEETKPEAKPAKKSKGKKAAAKVETVEPEESKPAEAAKPVDEPKPEPVVEELAGGIVEPEQGNEETKPEAKPAKKSKGKKAAAKVETVEPEESKPAEESKPEPEPEPAKKSKGKKAAKVETVEPEAVPVFESSTALPTSSSIEPVVATTSEVQTAEALDRAVHEVHEAKGHAVWDLGRAILRTYEGDLWKQRRDERGAPRYAGFAAFCSAELGMTAQHAYRVMDICLKFSRDDVVKVGVAKLALMLRVPEGEQSTNLLEQAREGMPLSEVAKRVHDLAGSSTRETGRKKVDTPHRQGKVSAKKAEAAKVIDVPEGSITVALSLGREKVELWDKGKVGIDRANSLEGKPVGEELMLNGVIRKYSVGVDKDGLLFLLIETKREAAKVDEPKPEAKPEAKPAKAKPASKAKPKK